MNAAPAPTLPADLAALLDAHGELRLTHPATGRPLRLVPGDLVPGDLAPGDLVPAGPASGDPVPGGAGGDQPDERLPTPAERAELDGRQTDLEAIREGVAEADAGLCRPWAEMRAELRAEFPFLTAPTATTAGATTAGATNGEVRR